MNRSASTHLVNAEQAVIQGAKDFNRVSVDLRGLSLVSLPGDFFAPATSLRRLDLSFNSLTILPSSLYELGNIRELYLRRNALRDLPESLKNAERLEILDVSHNCLRSLPECLGSMECLKMVNCSGNHIRLLEASSISAPNLSVFRVLGNPIRNVPPDVYLEGLAALRRHFDITTSIPDMKGISHLVCESEPSKTFRERLREIKLRRTKKRERLKKLTAIDLKPIEVMCPQQFKELVRTESAGQVQTSDYGSINSSHHPNIEFDFWEGCNRRTASDSEGSSCHGDHGSDTRGRISRCSEVGDWSNDSWDELARPDFEDIAEEMDCILPDRTRFLKKENVAVLIPEHNRMKRMRSEFHVDIMNELRLHPVLKKSWIMAGPVVSVGPDGTEFYEDRPAFIRLPLRVKLGNGQIRCFRSNTSPYEPPSWREMPRSEFEVCKEYVVIRTTHLSFFTILLDLSPVSVSTVVTPKEGGTLVVDQVPGLRVTFPPGSVKETIEATVKVISGDLDERLRTNLHKEDAVATPVVVLSPHGYLFQEGETNPVHVHLPVPNYLAITQKFGPLAKLSLWQSRTSEGDPVSWQRLQIEPKIYQSEEDDDQYFVDVSVSHFSLLTGLWEGIKSQIGLSYQGGAQNMKCQAWMLESKESNKFGLVVICHNAEKSIQDVGNYAMNVGGSLKPVSVVPGGDIVVKLSRSEYFEPDTSADQDETLEKVHSNFKGEEFEMQFACRFKGDAKPTNKDIFGKVLVKKRDSNQNMFAFNLIKKEEGEEDEAADPWAITSLRELADVHSILVNNNWRRLARSLGYTVSEMSRFEKLAEPFDELVAVFRRRRGSYEDFMDSFWKVARDIKLNPSEAPEPEETASSQWRSYFNIGNWFSLGSTGNSSRASSSRGASSRGASEEEEDENQPSTSFNANRKRPMYQRHSGSASGSTSSKRRRNQLGPPAQPNEEQLLQQLRISPQQPPTQPPYQHPYQPHSSPSGSHGSSPPGSWTSQMRHTPPHNSTAQGYPSTNLVQSSGVAPLMSARGAAPPGPPSHVAENYASTSHPHTFNPKNLEDEMQRSNNTEITQSQLYRIAPLIQAHWYKLARLIRNDENVESDIKVLRQQFEGADEQATQMLLQWREKCPDCCNRGMLYGALVDLNLKTVAKKCEEIYQRSRRPNPS